MWRPQFVILFIFTTNLSTFSYTYKITNDNNSKTTIIEAYDHQDYPNPHEEYIEENYSNEESYKKSSGRVVIGKWRNNGEALEPKWRDGDSVPLAPFSTISFKNGWRKDPDSREEDYQIEPEDNSEFKKGAENHTANKNSNINSDYDTKRIVHGLNSGTLIPTNAENYPLDLHHEESKHVIGYKNSHRRDDRQFNGASIHQENENSSERRVIAPISKVSRNDNLKENIQRSRGKYRETLENYPNEYELFENENDDPRPRKRRPPEDHEFPGSWSVDNNKKEGSHVGDEKEVITEIKQSSNMANDVRNKNRTSDYKNDTKSEENVELKTYLKMQGNNLSLSEILQQKNLTLADLLRGKPNAINILKSSNEKKFESVEEEKTILMKSTFTERPGKIYGDSISENPSWSTRRNDMIRTSNENSNFEGENDPTVLNFSQTRFNFETTTLPMVIKNPTKVDKTVNDTSLFNRTKLIIKDNETVSSEEFEHLNSPNDKRNKSDSHEFLKPLENRESLLTEATTVVEDGTEYPFNDKHVSVSKDRFVPNVSNDEDEIMEFSDYPATIMKKFITPLRYETATLNTRRKNIPLGAIRMSNPVEDTADLKLNIEHILSSDKKLSTIINETNDVNEDNKKKFVDEMRLKNFSNININEKDEMSEDIKNERQEMKKVNEETDTDSKERGYKILVNSNDNEKKTLEKDDDKLLEKDVKNEYERLAKDQENLTLNHKLYEVVIPKVDPQSRAEILELFSSGSSAERLERLLASRNMTIEELIALRQRGSSQVHLAEVFKAKEQSSTLMRQNLKTNYEILQNYKENKKLQTSETTEKILHVSKKNNSSDIENDTNSKTTKNDTENNKKKDAFETEAEYLATDLFDLFSEDKNFRKNVTTVDKTHRDPDNSMINPIIKFGTGIDPKKTVKNSDLSSMIEEFPTDNNIQKDSDGSSYYTSIETVKLPVQEEEIKRFPEIFEEEKSDIINSASSEEIGRVEEILNNDLKSIKTLYGMNDYEFSEKKALSKVKPSIIASGGILGVTIVVFLSIFIACRIRQKKKFAYKNSFTKAVFHNPVMTARKLSNTSSVNTIMVDVVATSTPKGTQKHDYYGSDDFEPKSDIDNDSLDANDSWDTIPDFMK